MERLDRHTACARLQNLKSVVSEDYGMALDYVLALMEQQRLLVQREQVVSMLTDRAQAADYIVLRGVLLDMAEAVSAL